MSSSLHSCVTVTSRGKFENVASKFELGGVTFGSNECGQRVGPTNIEVLLTGVWGSSYVPL